jgi:uncharacterized protein
MLNYVCKQILLKIASRCNINCTYCYWFRDKSVYEKPPILSVDIENIFVEKLDEHIKKYALEDFRIIFHGGEPLLFGKQRFFDLCEKIRKIEFTSNCKITLSITTNGLLIDDDWAAIFKYFGIGVTVSLDGTEEVHNKNRVDFKGMGTYQKVINAIELLKQYDVGFGVLCVCLPGSDPEALFNHFLKLDIKNFDVLIPDFTHEDQNIPSIASYYKKFFDVWYENKYYEEFDIRLLKSFVMGLLGFTTTSEALGYGPITTMMMHSDGSLEPLDVLKITGSGHTKSEVNILEHSIQDIQKVPLWSEVYEASINLPTVCKNCVLHNACGGGYIPHRWSKANRYNNPNIYCDDLKEIFGHIATKISEEISSEGKIMYLKRASSTSENALNEK